MLLGLLFSLKTAAGEAVVACVTSRDDRNESAICCRRLVLSYLSMGFPFAKIRGEVCAIMCAGRVPLCVVEQ